MNLFTSYLLVSLTAFIGVIAKSSPEFTLQLHAPDVSIFSSYNIFLNGALFSVEELAETCTGHIDENGSLVVNGHVVGQSRGYLTTAPQSNHWIVPSSWTISEGLLNLNGSSTFYAIPEGSPGVYMLSAGKKSTARGITKVNIKAIFTETIIIESWPVSSLTNGKISAFVGVPMVLVSLIAVGIFRWFRLRRSVMLSSNEQGENYDQQTLIGKNGDTKSFDEKYDRKSLIENSV